VIRSRTGAGTARRADDHYYRMPASGVVAAADGPVWLTLSADRVHGGIPENLPETLGSTSARALRGEYNHGNATSSLS
jgi:hypothetical protein